MKQKRQDVMLFHSAVDTNLKILNDEEELCRMKTKL